MKKKIYLAGGWFTAEQEEEHSRLYNCIKEKYDVFNPKIAGEIDTKTDNSRMGKILIGNIEAIKNADLVLVIYDYRDTGTIWEAGFAYAIDKPIVYYAEKNAGRPFNLMLAKTGRYAEDETALMQMLDSRSSWHFKDIYNDYCGEVE